MANSDWELWGTFSVADHLRPRPFVADVLVYNRLLIPVPTDDDIDRWDQLGWQPHRQRTILDILRDSDQDRVEEIRWDAELREEFTLRNAHVRAGLAAEAAREVADIQCRRFADPDAPPQGITRKVLADRRSEQRDHSIVRGVPLSPVDIVAAYESLDEFSTDTGAVETAEVHASPDDLLGGFVWPFAVPEESERSDLDLLKRAVEYVHQPQVEGYRQAFHRWRGRVVRQGKSPREAAIELQEAIDSYENWVNDNRRRVVARSACFVVAVGLGVAGALMDAFGLGTAGAGMQAGAAGMPMLGPITSRFFRGRLTSYDPSQSPGALFWEAKKGLT